MPRVRLAGRQTGSSMGRVVGRRRPGSRDADLCGVADYRPVAGGGWEATVTVEDMPTIRCRGEDLDQVAGQVQAALAALTRKPGLSVATVHQLDGDAAAWAVLIGAEPGARRAPAGDSLLPAS